MIYDIYTDGSFNGGIVTYAYVVIQDDKKIHHGTGKITDPEACLSYQIAGECQAVVEAIRYCKENGHKARIFYDYVGVKEWIADLFGGRPWKANKKITQDYRKFILENAVYIEEMKKVKSHSGNKWNDLADELAANVLF